jgi:ABC-type dipeptide/oligopeptide/nickel transport system ATPase subunit
MKLRIRLEKIQHLAQVEFELDIESDGLICITGKNGAGKTTLIKAIRNITNADTFKRTSSDEIFNPGSLIEYEFDGQKIFFEYDSALATLNSKMSIPTIFRSKIAVELPIPYGERFNFFQKISSADADIRRSIVLGQHSKPCELIEFLQDIYSHSKFDRLVEISIKKFKYYCVLLPNGRYLREDYFSSGEYFLISLYRRIVKGHGLIVIDEIDISLDAAAQVRLVKKLREFGKKYKVGFVFTTHSLAMMRTLHDEELFYMDYEQDTGVATITNVSYNYVKSILFGFTGWDKYILTEDDVLKDFIDYVIRTYCGSLFYQYKIIFIGGGNNTTDLMKRNSSEGFLSESVNVICVLDGDQKKFRHGTLPSVYCIPMESIEKALLADCLLGGLRDKFDVSKILNDDLNELRRYLTVKPLKSTLSASHNTSAIANILQRISLSVIKLFRLNIRIQTVRSKGEGKASSEKEFKIASKALFKYIVDKNLLSRQEIIAYLCARNESAVRQFAASLRDFLTVPQK